MEISENMLDRLDLPGDLKKMDYRQCMELCRCIRKIILKTVMQNGGHLASNLGTVELTVALHRVFDSPKDKFVWDVGHQAYTHKLLTGRCGSFDTLRKENGISGFIRPSESEHDAFISGHSSTSISAALGMAEAMRLDGDNEHHAIAIIGDGAFTGGLSYEGLNNAGKSKSKIIVILNHNEMSISKNVGAFAKYLSSIRRKQKYLDSKKAVEAALNKMPVIGDPMKNVLRSSKSILKLLLYHSTMFEELGFAYLGPVDGHNIAELDETLRVAKQLNKPVFIHVNTVKGKGYKPSEENPGEYHSVSGASCRGGKGMTFSDNFGTELARLADDDNSICAISAAMKYGTGLQYFAAKHPKRFFDVGIAEQHAVTFACGLAKCGKLPVFAVYSSFLQRSFDQLIHDAAIDNTHIVLAVDRAGIVGEDGETHQGIFDIPMFTCIPNTTIFSPSDLAEQTMCLEEALYKTEGIAAVRYPRGGEYGGDIDHSRDTCGYHLLKKGSKCLSVSFGRIIHELYAAAENADTDVLKLVKIYPVEDEIIDICMNYDRIIIFEESSERNGIGSLIAAKLLENEYCGEVEVAAISGFVPQAEVSSALKKYGLDAKSMADRINKV